MSQNRVIYINKTHNVYLVLLLVLLEYKKKADVSLRSYTDEISENRLK